MEPVTWGVLSTANIGVEKVLPAMIASPHVRLAALASRDEERGRRAADRLGIPKTYGSYEALLADPEIEAIYNPLPNHLHVPWTLRAMAAGKHVLCEKPVALDTEEAASLISARDAAGVQVMEAFMIRWHPQWLRAREIVRSGRLGDVRFIQVCFSYYNDDPDNVRNMADIGGGALLDIGCYALVSAKFIFEREPRRAIGLISRDPSFGTDRLTSGLMDFGDDRHLGFCVSTQLTLYQRVRILGTKARLEIEIPFNALPGQGMRLILDDGDITGANDAVETVAACDQYTLQAEAFGRIIRGIDPPLFPIEDAVANMRALDALFRSGESGRWEDTG